MSILDEYKSEIIKTIFIIVVAIVTRFLINIILKKTREKFQLQKNRGIIIRKIINGIIFFATVTLIFIVWGGDKKELGVLLSSFFAILGIALFAQWSMLSNITSSIIFLFLNHPAKIGDNITILDPEKPVHGKITDIGTFFMIVKLENGDIVTIPNSLIFQKMVQINSE